MGQNISALKGKNTLINPNVVSRYQLKIPLVFIKLHKLVFFTCDIFFMKQIPFFLTLSQKIYFKEGNHLENYIGI